MFTNKIEQMIGYRFPLMAPDTGSAGSGSVDGVEDDNPAEEDEDEDIKGLLAPEIDEEEEPEEEEEAPEEDAAAKKPDPEKKDEPAKDADTKPKERVVTMTQDELDRIIEQRLARDRRTRAEEEAARAEQKSREEQFNRQIQAKYDAKVKRYTDLGLDEEAAKAAAYEDVEKDVRLAQLENKLVDREKQDAKITGMIQYNQQKNEILAKIPLAAKYIKEIDAFAQNGAACGFEAAAKYIIGEKVASGELLNDIKTATEQKTLANIGKRAKAKVEGGSLPGDTSKQVTLTPQERKLCRNLGLTEKEWIESKQKTSKKR